MIQTIESREVAKMIGYSRHDNLLQKIDTIILYMRKSPDLKVKVGEYFIESEYYDDNNQLRKIRNMINVLWDYTNLLFLLIMKIFLLDINNNHIFYTVNK